VGIVVERRCLSARDLSWVGCGPSAQIDDRLPIKSTPSSDSHCKASEYAREIDWLKALEFPGRRCVALGFLPDHPLEGT
jgi:hypothetical protein